MKKYFVRSLLLGGAVPVKGMERAGSTPILPTNVSAQREDMWRCMYASLQRDVRDAQDKMRALEENAGKGFVVGFNDSMRSDCEKRLRLANCWLRLLGEYGLLR